MYEIVYHGSLFNSGCEMLVNPVNCVGVDGAGLALEFKERFPANSQFYRQVARAGAMHDGAPLLYPTGTEVAPRYIVNFPTKWHWQKRSDAELIFGALAKMTLIVHTVQPWSIAFPALGCGLGGLPFDLVELMIRERVATWDTRIEVKVYAPQREPEASLGTFSTVDHLAVASVGNLLVHDPSREPRHHGPLGQ